MKTLFLSLIVWFGFNINNCLSQSFINGDFEINSATTCDYNNIDDVFNTKISNVTAYGKGFAQSSGGFVGEIDLQTLGCFVDPQNENWCIGLSSDTTSTSDAITIELTTNLIAGNDYELSFNIYGNTTFQSNLSNIEVGETLTDTLFGVLIDSFTPDTNSWKQNSVVFTATQNSNYISVRTKIGMPGWTQIDNFSINSVSTSFNNNDFKSNRIVYPNPASTNVIVDFNESISSGSATLISPSGQLLREIKIKNNRNVNLDLTRIPSGVYFIKIESEVVSEILRFIKK